jgi:hypothetical protein
LVSRADRTIDTEQWDRMGQLYASIKTGHVMALVAPETLGRLGFSAKNRFYRVSLTDASDSGIP